MANIKVAVRVRPISEREINFTGSEIVVRTEEKAISLTNLKVSSSKAGDSRERTRKYGFDYCFDSSDPREDKYASQSRIYETLGESMLDVLFGGFNSCLVAYGQSASGKTYTMMGSKDDPGLTPRICEGLFLRLINGERSDTNFDVSVSYLEVYNERVRDLLRSSPSSAGLKVREHPRLGPYVQGLTHHPVSTLGSLISRVEEGTRARKTASTLQNPTSSRSHALLTLSLRPSSSDIGQKSSDATNGPRNVSRNNEQFSRCSKLHLVDLAGSESAAACGGINRLKEGANINKSLVALGNVISALAERGSSGSGPGRRFIPYRDSALTWLLKDALGGNATTIMLATISPASGSYNETSHTLRFAQRAQSVVNRPVINEDPVSRIIRELRAEVARLKSLLIDKSVDPDRKFTCTCQRDAEQDAIAKDQPRSVNDRHDSDVEKPKAVEDHEVSLEVIDSRIPERRHSTSDGLPPSKQLSGLVKRFGSFEIVRESRTSSLDSIECDSYNRAKVSELMIDDKIDEPVFVDIPTLVAVLIKPDDNVEATAHQIEEIGSDGTPEDVIDAEFSVNVDNQTLSPSDEPRDSQSSGERQNVVSIPIDRDFIEPQKDAFVEFAIEERAKGKLLKHDSIDGLVSAKPVAGLRSWKKYGSIENLTRKREIAWSFQRSHTNLDKRNGSLDRIKKLNNIKEIEDPRTIRSANSLRNFGGWISRDLERKDSNDSDKSLKEIPFGRSKTPARKQSVDCSKRKTSKDSSSSSSKDELSSTSVGAHTHERTVRKGSLEQEQSTSRIHTPIQRARRAEIVAAVTERLYSCKKLTEDANALTATTASTPASEVRSPESTDVKLASATRMRLQEISRKMLAKRRRICAETQTDNQQTIRVRDASCITEEPKIISKDACVLTDRHEDYTTLPALDCPVRRVKEMATSIDADIRDPIVRCKDAANLTDFYYEDCETVISSRNDSGIMSDDAQNYADSNLSSTEISDSSPIGRCVEMIENSTNTGSSDPSNSESQTRREDLERNVRCSGCHERFCDRHCRPHCSLDHSDCNETRCHTEKNVISISLPEMVNITIETSNGMESKIKVFDGNESVDDRATMISFKDNTAQTERNVLEVATSTDDTSGQVYFHQFSAVTKPVVSQSDGKTFRIENIFHEPRVSARTNPRIEIPGDTLEDIAGGNSFIVTNSVGTSSVPETRENATGMETTKFLGSNILLGIAATRSLPAMMNMWHSRWSDCVSGNLRKNQQDLSISLENDRSLTAIAKHESCTNYGKNKVTDRKHERQSILESNQKVLDKYRGYREEFSGLMKQVSAEIGKKESADFSMTGLESHLKTSKEDSNDFLIAGLKSPSIIAMLDRQINNDQDTNFSDDSLDLMDDRGVNHPISIDPPTVPNPNNPKEDVFPPNEQVCPPDLVAHTKKDITESTISFDHFDFDDEGHHVELPKTKLDSATAECFSTPIGNFKTLILGDPSCMLNSAEDSHPIDFRDQYLTETLIDYEDCLDSTIDVVEDLERCPVNGGHPNAPRSIMKKYDSRLARSNCAAKRFHSEKIVGKKVRFADEVNSTRSEDEISENATSDEDSSLSGSRDILKEYLDQAVVFMRNMNSMNEYMSAAKGSSTRRTRDRCRDKSKRRNYIEYGGRRISLESDTEKLSTTDEDDEVLDFNVESYDRCMRSIDRLEECLARVKRHDETLRDKYPVGDKDESTGARLDLAGLDFSDSRRGLQDDSNSGDQSVGINSNCNSVDLGTDETDDGNNNPVIRSTRQDFVLTDNLKKLRARRFSRFSELRKRNPASYSQLRSRYVSQAVDARGREEEDTLCTATTDKVESSKVDDPEDTIVPGALRTPNCFLVLPKTTRNEIETSDRFKGCTQRQRFSLSKYDSSNESSSSNEALASFVESIGNAARSADRIRYPGSPRAKFLQLLSERRRIVENTRSTGAS